MNLTRESALEVLGNITEPDLKKDIVSLNLVELLEFDGDKVKLVVNVSNPAMHARKRT
jgi:ATP-binding protein involved in chromosome partitioning